MVSEALWLSIWVGALNVVSIVIFAVGRYDEDLRIFLMKTADLDALICVLGKRTKEAFEANVCTKRLVLGQA